MRFVKDIFQAFGGNSEIAEITGEKYPTVSSWLLRCSIPPKHWGALVEAASARGIDLDFAGLAQIAANRAKEKALRSKEARAAQSARVRPEPAQ